MDFMDLLPEMLRAKKKPPEEGLLVKGGDAAVDPAYAAYAREAKSMGEPVMTREQFHKR